MKRTILFLLVFVMILSALSAGFDAAEFADDGVPEVPSETDAAIADAPTADRTPASVGASKGAADYTYSIEPLLAPFNDLFFVRTDNPDPFSFRFYDKSTVYYTDEKKSPVIQSLLSERGTKAIFADVAYEDTTTGRVNGGYIFCTTKGNTDGGEVVLQVKNESDGWVYDESSGYLIYDEESRWKDTKLSYTLPVLKDAVDYLIDTYADKDTFFGNMDAVQRGLEDICLYSGSYIRGELEQVSPYWTAAAAGHIDQSLYIYSPYSRRGSESLFASRIYPYKLDSISFPGMMRVVSARLDSSASSVWNSNYHWLIDVTYNGETHTYGGAGNIKGKGVGKEDILKRFTFDKNDKITMEGAYQLLVDYSKLEIKDDVPSEGALTWESMCDTVKDGAWVRLICYTLEDGEGYGEPTYTYLYTREDKDRINDGKVGDNGSRYYISGKLGYFRDTWVDGRYINEWRHVVPGATFAEHPTSKIFVKKATVPLIRTTYSRSYDYEAQRYNYTLEIKDITEVERGVSFEYNSKEDLWIAGGSVFNYPYTSYEQIKQLIEEGKLDAKYLDMLTLTQDEVAAMHVDRKTDSEPMKGYIYDGSTLPGTPFGFDYLVGDTDGNGAVEAVDATLLQRCVAGMETPYSEDELLRGDADLDDAIDLSDATAIQFYLAGMKANDRIGIKVAE